MSCANGRFTHLFSENGFCRDCGVRDPQRGDLDSMAEDAATRAMACAQTALEHNVPMSLTDGARWASIAMFLRGEIERRRARANESTWKGTPFSQLTSKGRDEFYEWTKNLGRVPSREGVEL